MHNAPKTYRATRVLKRYFIINKQSCCLFLHISNPGVSFHYHTLYSTTHLSMFHAVLTGHYVSVMATNPSRPNTKARYVSTPFLSETGAYCLSFWYQIYGADVGTLRLRLQDGTSDAVRWSRTGDQGQTWNKAQVPLKIASDQSKVRVI